MENKSKRIYDNPWLALSTYEERDKDRFKGREIDIEKACEWLRSRNILTEASIEGFRKVLEE